VAPGKDQRAGLSGRRMTALNQEAMRNPLNVSSVIREGEL